MQTKLKEFLDNKVAEYDRPAFIKDDPICIPHLFTRPQDIEIAGFFAAIFAWGNRTIIINKSRELLGLMDNAPYQFITGHSDADLKRLLHFKHRTFNTTDLLYFIHFLRHHYSTHASLEPAFSQWMGAKDADTEQALSGFYRYFVSLDETPPRTRKHIASPEKNSTCKRLNMFLRWMVRRDKAGVDFGLWRTIRPAQLVCPIDVHVARVAWRFDLLQRNAIDWQAAIELTAWLRTLDPQDPVKYDFALFGLGAIEKF
jgi:uncharacterized protein (TIGR02757 family)